MIKLEKWFGNTTTEGLPLLLEAAVNALSDQWNPRRRATAHCGSVLEDACGEG
ncbi:hypothetical protein [Bradyrhizobium diazoefficiens]|uniref:hypothetical protein n=1 Tax=Bradyrhizobium diazoefficiens TaxID=1355477 RepID=UPI0004B3D57F|nr:MULTISPECIES: hypothetical protein [Bradyrhizobium]